MRAVERIMRKTSREYNVLIVEADEKKRENVGTHLKRAGYHVFSVPTGLEAIEMLENLSVDLIISDFIIPEMGGYSLFHRIQQDFRFRDLPFLFVTDNIDVVEKKQGLRSGIDDILLKPYDPVAVVAHVESMMTRLESFQQLSRLDMLTGLLNRQALEKDVRRELLRLLRYGRFGTLILLEIDKLKEFNARFGHPLGDTALIEFAGLIQSFSRDSDTIGRYTGDKFMMFLPETKQAPAVEMVKRLQDRYTATDSGVPEWKLSFCAGIIEAPFHGDADFDQLCTRIENSLDEAKAAGLSQLRVWSETKEEKV
jgi:diguanylate cyclase (GGDEF)-like protein